MEYELTILDRIVLVQVLQAVVPQFGSRMFYKDFERVAGEASIPQPEQDAISFRIDKDDGQVKWDNSKAQVKVVDIPECIRVLIEGRLKELDKQEQLRPEHLPVYDKFVKEEDDGDEGV